MHRIVSLITFCVFLCLQIQHGESCRDSYLVGIPNQWFEGFDQTIFVSLYDKSLAISNTIVQVTVDIVSVSSPKSVFQVKSNISPPNYRGLIKFQIPSTFPSGAVNVSILGNGNNIYFKNSTQNVYYRKDTEGVYVITDKPVYRALDTVNARVIGIDGKLLPLNNNLVSVYILDPNQNLIKQYLDVPFVQGIVDNISLDISDKPQVGTYQIKVVQKDDGNTIYQSFEIMEYVLPKFDITVSPPNYILKTDDYFQGTIDAKYTYGKSLEGQAYIKLEAQNFYWIYADFSNQPESYNYKVERIIKLNNGKITFTIPVMAFNTYSLTLTVNVTEQFTGESQQKVFYISIYDNSFTASIDPNAFVPGSNTFSLSIVNPISQPIPNLNLAIDYTFITGPLDSQPANVSTAVKTGLDGKASLTLNVVNVTTQIIIKIRRLDTNEITKLIIFKKKPAVPGSGNEFQFKVQDKLQSNTVAKILVGRNSDGISLKCDNIPYLVISRSMVLNTGSIQLCNNQVYKEINFPISYLHAPYATVILYYINATNSLVVQSQKFQINGIYNNNVSLAFDRASAQPGQNVTLSVNARPNSVASVVVIDQSVALFRTPIDLTNDLILSQISRYQTNWYESSPVLKKKRQVEFINGYWQFPPSLQNLEGNGFTILSDLCSLEPTFQKYNFQPRPMAGGGGFGGMAVDALAVNGAAMANIAAPSKTSQSGSQLAQVDRLRTDFRESWIWTTLKTDINGFASLTSRIPDTITSWIASGFAISSQYGLGIAEKTNITGFKPFFVTLNLPSSIIRGELFTLQAIVSNYLNVDLSNVVVTLVKSSAFQKVTVVNGTYKFSDVTGDIKLTIPSISSNSARSVSFPIVARQAGLIDLTVKAQSTVAADGLTQKLRVKFEGIQESYNLAYSVDLGSSTWLTKTGTFSEKASLTFPSNTIQDSQYCEVQVIGDLLGVAFSNLDQLIVKPYGCGEQNLLTLTPNIYAYNYLQVVRRPDSQSLIDKTKANIVFGYQNQLKYRRFDGSFSAFGIIDDSGSSWLTAFVVKSFAQAAKIVLIDQNVITTAISWLLQQQNSDGSFREPGRVIHKDMQSGVNSKETQTAYIAISLLETNITTSDVTNGIKKALGYLESRLSSISDVYALSLITYALTLGGSSYSQTAFNKFNALANTTSAGLKYWSKPDSDAYSNYYWRRYVPTNGIEMTSYGLLIYLLRNDISGSVPIVRWLVSKTNSLGAYGSTQSTVLGLQSLSTFGVRTNAGGNFDLTIRVDASSTQFTTFKVNNNNTLVLQSWQVSPCPSSLSLSATGTGSAFLQIIATYNVPKLTEPPVFTLTQTTQSKISCSKYILQTCATYTGKDNATGMSIVESNIISGFSADKSELNGLVNASLGLKLIELSNDGSKVSFYFDQLTNVAKCVTWSIKRNYPVSSQQPVSVRVYDYYKPELQTTILFNVDSCNICDLTSEVSGCAKK